MMFVDCHADNLLLRCAWDYPCLRPLQTSKSHSEAAAAFIVRAQWSAKNLFQRGLRRPLSEALRLLIGQQLHEHFSAPRRCAPPRGAF